MSRFTLSCLPRAHLLQSCSWVNVVVHLRLGVGRRRWWRWLLGNGGRRLGSWCLRSCPLLLSKLAGGRGAGG